MTYSDADRELVLKATRWLVERDGEHPTPEAIQVELARRLREALEMYQGVAAELAYLRNTRP